MKTKKIYEIEGMHCSSCAMLIEGELEDRGIIGTCNFAKQIVTIETEGEIHDDVVKQAVIPAGYRVRK